MSSVIDLTAEDDGAPQQKGDKKRKRGATPSSGSSNSSSVAQSRPWWEQAAAQIYVSITPHELDAVGRKLDELKRQVLDIRFGNRVRLVQSNQTTSMNPERHDIHLDQHCRKVNAKFTAGPKGAPFYINFDNMEEGGSAMETNIDSDLFSIVYEYDDMKVFNLETDIDSFLIDAGLKDAQPQKGGKINDASKRQKRVFGELIEEAINLLNDKYDKKEYQSGLGMEPKEIFEHLDEMEV